MKPSKPYGGPAPGFFAASGRGPPTSPSLDLSMPPMHAALRLFKEPDMHWPRPCDLVPCLRHHAAPAPLHPRVRSAARTPSQVPCAPKAPTLQSGRVPLQSGRVPLQSGRMPLQSGRVPLQSHSAAAHTAEIGADRWLKQATQCITKNWCWHMA